MPILPGLWMCPGMIPIMQASGVMIPWVLGPIRRVRDPRSAAFTRTISRIGIRSVMQTASGTSASIASMTAAAACAGGTNMALAVAPVAARASFTVSKTGRPRCSPVRPGLTPPTIRLPYSIARPIWKVATRPVKPWQMIFVCPSMRIAISTPDSDPCRNGAGGRASAGVFPVMSLDAVDGIGQIARELGGQGRIGEQLLSELGVRAGEAYDDGNADRDLSRGEHHGFRDQIATDDAAAEDVHEDAGEAGVPQHHTEPCGDLLAGCDRPDVHEVGRLDAAQLEQVDGRHAEAGAIRHAANRARHGNVIDLMTRGLQLFGRRVLVVAQGFESRMPKERVVVQDDARVESDGAAICKQGEGVELDQRGIEFPECPIQPFGDIAHLRHGRLIIRHSRGQLIGGTTARRLIGIAPNLDDLFRARDGAARDRNATSPASKKGHLTRAAIDVESKIELSGRLHRFLDVKALDPKPCGAGLRGDQRFG